MEKNIGAYEVWSFEKKMKKISAATKFELLVQRIYKAILEYEGEQYRIVEVKHNIRIDGFSRKYQVDVYWEYEIFGLKKQCIVEVKNYKRPVESKVVQSLKAELDDIPGHPDGLIVAINGFQNGAIDFAKTHGIRLVCVNPVLKKAMFNINIPELISGKPRPIVNTDILKTVLIENHIQIPCNLHFCIHPDATIHYPDGHRQSFYDVVQEMIGKIPRIENNVKYSLNKDMPDGTTIDCEGSDIFSTIPIRAIEYEPIYKILKYTTESQFNKDIDYIVSYIDGIRMKYSNAKGIVEVINNKE